MKRFTMVAFANIFIGLYLPISIHYDISSIALGWLPNSFVYLIGAFSMFCGFCLLDPLYNRAGILLTSPILIMSIISIPSIYTYHYTIMCIGYFLLWLYSIINIYKALYKKDLFIMVQRWIGIIIIISAFGIAFDNHEINSVGVFFRITEINPIYYSVLIFISGILIITKKDKFSLNEIIIFSLPLIIQDIYTLLYFLFISLSKVLVPIFLFKILILIKIIEGDYSGE